MFEVNAVNMGARLGELLSELRDEASLLYTGGWKIFY